MLLPQDYSVQQSIKLPLSRRVEQSGGWDLSSAYIDTVKTTADHQASLQDQGGFLSCLWQGMDGDPYASPQQVPSVATSPVPEAVQYSKAQPPVVVFVLRVFWRIRDTDATPMPTSCGIPRQTRCQQFHHSFCLGWAVGLRPL